MQYHRLAAGHAPTHTLEEHVVAGYAHAVGALCSMQTLQYHSGARVEHPVPTYAHPVESYCTSSSTQVSPTHTLQCQYRPAKRQYENRVPVDLRSIWCYQTSTRCSVLHAMSSTDAP
eukprot:2802711-Rhodomonas_salina.7